MSNSPKPKPDWDEYHRQKAAKMERIVLNDPADYSGLLMTPAARLGIRPALPLGSLKVKRKKGKRK